MADLEPLTPEWWVARLYRQLAARRPSVDFFEAYYTGNHPLPWLAPQAREEFRRVLAMTRTNYMGLVCDATAEAITIEGFRFGRDNKPDDATWRIWQGNNLDSDSDQGILEMTIASAFYYLVAPNPADESLPNVWVEHPSQATVEFEPGSRRRVRAAGLKVWDDDWTGDLHATLYLPGIVVKYKAQRPAAGATSGPRWEPREVRGEVWPAPNPLGVVPLIEVPNNPRLLTGGRSELADVTDTQDRINKTVADRLVTQDFGAFPQKWASAWPQFVDDARTVPTPPIDVGRNRMVTTEVAETKFGQWDAAPLDPYSMAKREDVKDIAARTRLPVDMIVGELNNVNGSTLVASRAGHVSKVRQRSRPVAEASEEAMRLARRIAGLPPIENDMRMETIFSDPQFRTEGERADATIKKVQAGVISLRQAREDLGYSQTQIERIEADIERERAAAVVADPLAAFLQPVAPEVEPPSSSAIAQPQ